MLIKPRTLVLTTLAVLVVGCSKSPVTNMTGPAATPTTPVSVALPDSPPANTATDDVVANGFQDGQTNLPAARLPASELPNLRPEVNQPKFGQQTASEAPGGDVTELSADGTQLGLPSLPGMPAHMHKLPSGEVLPGLPGSQDRFPANLPGFGDHPGALLPGFGAAPSVATPND